jgi:hypothetical protein
MFTVAFAVLGLAADPTPNEEILLAKGDGYFVHAVRSGPLSRGRRRVRVRPRRQADRNLATYPLPTLNGGSVSWLVTPSSPVIECSVVRPSPASGFG